MSLLDPNEALKIFLLENHEIIRSWYNNTNIKSLDYLKIPEFSLKNYSEENIRSMIENNDATSISEYFRVINCLAYNRKDKIKFKHLEELLKSGYELSILSLLIKSPIDNLEERFANQVFGLLESNEIYDWMTRSDSDVSESLKVKEKIVSFATYFSFVLKFSQERLKFIRELGPWNLIKTSEFLMNFANDRNECADEFFSFSCEALKFFKIEFNFLRELILNNLIDNICSWHTFSNVLSLANHIKFEQSTIEKLCQIIHDYFYWNFYPLLDFFTSREEVLKISYNYLNSNYLANMNDKASIGMMNKILEVLFIYTSNIAKTSASTLFEDIKLDEFIKVEGVIDQLILPIENIINAQLTRSDRWYNLLDTFFETLPSVKDKSLERAKSHVQMLALYLYLDRNRIQEWKIKKIQQYLQSFTSQFEEINNWTKIEILDFFKATFSYLPTIQSDFNDYLNRHLIPRWSNLKKSINEEVNLDPDNENLLEKSELIAAANTLAVKIKKLQINRKDQFNYLAVNEFEDFIGTYNSIIRGKDVEMLISFYGDIIKYLEDFNFNKISYEDSKNRVTIAKYFICLIKNSLTEFFKENANKLKKKLQELEDKVINIIELETMEEIKDTSMKIISLESEEENLNWFIEGALTGDQRIIGDSSWNICFTRREDQANKLEEFRNSLLHKMVFSDDTEHFILKQYLASHLTRLFSGTLNKENADFFTECEQRAIKLHFRSPEKLNKTQKEELTTILFSTPARGAFLNENIWNENIGNLAETTYFANIPDNLSGMTVFGGTILLHPSLSQNDDLKSCARKITFIHEAAHAMKKYNEGSYNPKKKTLKSRKTPLLSGMPGNREFLAELKYPIKNEGEKLIENALFGAFFTKINKSQIDYINNLSNWRDDADSFKRHIEEKGQEVSKTYELARGSHYISGTRNDGCEYY
ncbi:unnamed protein product [Blepharisma stoltei]|uniref:Uncharacterized protein n=1 Tax=Blepharisma stoltei TaxID=1481888 RepID=A0AAU9JQ23_9CILI|nr:unnamed protein product [Blepharisma stoltei]